MDVNHSRRPLKLKRSFYADGEKKMNTHKSERGQAIVLIAIALVAIFGFAALAVDGGRSYSEKRRAQNAADSAAYAAARAAADGENWRQAALNQAAMNDYNDTDAAPNPGSVMDVMVYHPPVDGPYSPGEIHSGEDPNEYYQVKIRVAIDKIFSQIVFPGKEEISVEAVTKAKPIKAVSFGNAMHATNHNACKAVWFDGGGNTSVDGGNVFSNSEAVGNCASGQQNGSGAVTVTNGDIQVVGSWRQVGGSGAVSPNPLEGEEDGVYHEILEDVPEPDCSSLPNRNDSNQALQPGRYAGGIAIHNGTWTMAPGIYCLSNDFSVNGGSLNGKGVLIVMLDGSVGMEGNANISLLRADNIVDSAGNQFGGMLFYMPKYNQGGIDLGGNSGTMYAGTIYAPGTRSSSKPKCTFGGNSGTLGYNANIICDTIQVHGNANLVIQYKAEQNYRLPPMIELSE